MLWADVFHPDEDDRLLLTSYCGAIFQPQSQTEEIESSPRFVDTEEQIIMNSHFLYQSDEEYHAFGVNFIIRINIVITMRFTESVIDKERVVLFMLHSEWFPPDCNAPLQILLKDIDSLCQHAEFNFSRLECLQDSLLGLFNLDQNRIIKIFSVLAIIFMPPTWIASAYDMNFRIMPELEWIFVYSSALFLMVGFSVLTYLVFRLPCWL